MSAPAPLLSTHKLVKYFDIGNGRRVHAVDDISLAIAPNEVLGLVGESGSGKSTFGKTLAGLWPKTSGSVSFKGQTLPQTYQPEDFRRLARDIQMIFQDPYSSLNPRMTIGEVLGEGLMLQGVAKAEIRERAAAALRTVGLLPDHLGRFPHEFSGGQRQRVGIARAMIVRPSFVICDEPISALDVSIQAQVVNLLADLKAAMGLSLLFISHDLSMVRFISDRTAVMYLGALMELGPADEVYFNPKHPYSQLLISSKPVPEPRQEKQRLHTPIKGEIPSPVNIGPGCRFAARCPSAKPECRTLTPFLKEVAPGHQVACHLFN